MTPVTNTGTPTQLQSQSDSDDSPPVESIPTPTTVEEFRSNLQKYFVTIQDSSDDEPKLYLGNEHDPVPISELDSLADLYEITGTGWNSPTGEVPQISPLVEEIVSVRDWYMTHHGPNYTLTYFEVSENYRIHDSQIDFLVKSDPKWVRIDHPIYRRFFFMTLGEFSGYQRNGFGSITRLKKLTLHISYELGDPNEPELCPTNGQGSNWEMDTMLNSILEPFGYEEIGRGSGFGQRDLEFQFNPDEIRVPFERIDLGDGEVDHG
jgi:hypothetical protein